MIGDPISIGLEWSLQRKRVVAEKVHRQSGMIGTPHF
jgi:hypothetical protein